MLDGHPGGQPRSVEEMWHTLSHIDMKYVAVPSAAATPVSTP